MFSFSWIIQYWQVIVTGMVITMGLAISGAFAGIAIGILCNRICLRENRVIVAAVKGFVEFVRNTPFLVQLFFIFFGLPALGVKLTPLQSAFLATSLNVGAYSAEIIRAGLSVTPRGQFEAALSLGMSRSDAFWYIALLPSFQRTWPALSSQLVLVMLGSAVVSQVSVDDLSSAANFIQSRNFRAFETYFFLTAVYMILSIIYRYLLACLGRRIFPRGSAL